MTPSPKSIVHFISEQLNDFGIVKEVQGDEVTVLPFNVKTYELKIPASSVVSTVCQCSNYSFENDEAAHLWFPGYTFRLGPTDEFFKEYCEELGWWKWKDVEEMKAAFGGRTELMCKAVRTFGAYVWLVDSEVGQFRITERQMDVYGVRKKFTCFEDCLNATEQELMDFDIDAYSDEELPIVQTWKCHADIMRLDSNAVEDPCSLDASFLGLNREHNARGYSEEFTVDGKQIKGRVIIEYGQFMVVKEDGKNNYYRIMK